MRSMGLAVLALALPLAAQTVGGEAKPVVETEKIWKLETTGLGG